MIFSSKRNNAPRHSSNTEACVSIIGLFLAVGLIGGLSALVYGLVKGNSVGTIGGGVILGVSAFFSVILALVFVYCLKNNDVNSNENDHCSSVPGQQPRQNGRRAQHRPVKHEEISSHEITAISGTCRHDRQFQPQQVNEYDLRKLSGHAPSIGLTDSTNSGCGRQLPSAPSKISSFALNQNNGVITNSNRNPANNTNVNRESDNRH